VPAFVFWGFGNALRSKKESKYVGKLFGKKVSSLEYQDALLTVKNQAIMQFGDKFSEIQQHLNLESRAWEWLMLMHEAKKHKIKVSDQEVIEAIEKFAFFQRKGQFDKKIYYEILQYVFRTQGRIFEEQIRQKIMLAKLYDEATANVKIDDNEIKQEYRKSNEEISIEYIAGLAADFLKEVTTTEEEIKDYFTKKSFQFKQPITFNIEYASSDSEDKIKNIILRLDKKEDFAKLAKEFNLELKETGLFAQTGPIPTIGWSPQIFAFLSKAKAGEVMPVTNIDKNYYALRLKERKEAYIPEFEKIKDKVKEALTKEKAQEIAKKRTEDCLKKLKELYQQNPRLIDFSKTAKEYGLKSDITKPFKYGSYIEGIGASDTLWTTAEQLKEDNFSEVLNISSGYYIIKLKSRSAIDDKKFAAEKKDFGERLLTQKKQEHFAKFVEELKRKTQ
jgi:hypothetical protein